MPENGTAAANASVGEQVNEKNEEFPILENLTFRSFWNTFLNLLLIKEFQSGTPAKEGKSLNELKVQVRNWENAVNWIVKILETMTFSPKIRIICTSCCSSLLIFLNSVGFCKI